MLESAAREPVRTVLSGPAGGVVGASAMARLSGYDRIISFDMGGTSTDVAWSTARSTPPMKPKSPGFRCASPCSTSTPLVRAVAPLLASTLAVHSVSVQNPREPIPVRSATEEASSPQLPMRTF